MILSSKMKRCQVAGMIFWHQWNRAIMNASTAACCCFNVRGNIWKIRYGNSENMAVPKLSIFKGCSINNHAMCACVPISEISMRKNSVRLRPIFETERAKVDTSRRNRFTALQRWLGYAKDMCLVQKKRHWCAWHVNEHGMQDVEIQILAVGYNT